MEVKILDVKRLDGAGCLKALVAFRLGDSVFRDFRVIRRPGQKAWVAPPQLSWRDENGKRRYKSLVALAEPLKKQIDSAILAAYRADEQEKT